ncbi:MAG: glycerol-3-phosphate 1-O-acyltransferase PlsY [Clostridiales bacterium]|nr:glycerol-3-phosphate 1-O-acyltransferase PlsY [Clostridiales bacterium]
MNPIVQYVILAVASYMLGSVSAAVFISRKAGGFDIREKGSGNAGSTNVLRVMGVKWGVITLLIDMAKGALPTLIGLLWARETGAYVAGGAVLLGHAFPILERFRGGKCVASSGGVLLVLNPLLTLAALAIDFSIMFISRIVSIGTIIIFILYPVGAFLFPGPAHFGWFALGVSILVLILHRGNIKRLLTGTEKRLNPSKK